MSVIGVQLEGDTDFLDTQDDTSIEVVINNPLLGDAEVLSPGSYSLPMNLPGGKDSPKNAAKLKHPDVIENNAAYQIQKATLFLKDTPFKKGTLKASSTDDAAVISANFLFGLSSLNPGLKDARLRDVMNENVVIDATGFTKLIYVKKITAGDWSVTVNGKSYTGATAAALTSAINADHSAAEDKGIYVANATLENVAPNWLGLAAPYVIIKATKFYTFFNVGLGITTHLSQDSTDILVPLSASVDPAEAANYRIQSFDMSGYYAGFTTFLANYISGAFPSNKYRFPVMFNPTLYASDGNVTKQNEIINGVYAGGLVLNDCVDLKNKNTLQPFVLLKYVLDKIASTFGFTWEGDFYTDAALPGILIDNAHTLDVPLDYIGDNKYVFWKQSFNVNDLVPDMTVIDFLKGIASRYNLAIYPHEHTNNVRIKYRENVALAKEYFDLTEFVSPVPANEDHRITGFNMVVEKDESDLFSVTETLAIGTPQQTLPITCGRLHQTNSSSIYDGVISGPRVSRKNNDTGFRLRVFHFLGMVDNGVFSYQAADLHGPGFYEALDDFILNQGIYSRCYKYWLLFKKNWRLITLKAMMPLRLLREFDYEKKLRFDRSNYLLNQMKLKVTNKSKEKIAVEFQVYTMK